MVLIMGLPDEVLCEETECFQGTITFIKLSHPQPYTVEMIDLPTGKTQQLVQATIDRPEIRDFCYSPDGTYFLLTMGSGDNWYANTEIYIGEEGGKKLKKLTDNNIYDGDTAWSPDSKRFAFTRGWGIAGRVFVLDLESAQEQQVSAAGLEITRMPAWLSDSQRLVVISKTSDGIWGFAEIDINRGVVRWLYKGEVSILAPCLSPDRRSLACIVQSRRPSFNWSYELEFMYRVNVLDLDTERIKPVDDGPEGFERDLWPIWSPDSKRLAWLRDDRKNQISKIVVHDPETKKSLKIALPERIADVYSLVWSPDGKHLAFVTQNQAPKYTLRVVTLDSGRYRNVVTTASQIQCLYWRQTRGNKIYTIR